MTQDESCSLSTLIAYAPPDVLDSYITARQPKRGEASEDGWVLYFVTAPTPADDHWVCAIACGEIWNGQQEPPDYGWQVEERGATLCEAMANAIIAAHKEVW